MKNIDDQAGGERMGGNLLAESELRERARRRLQEEARDALLSGHKPQSWYNSNVRSHVKRRCSNLEPTQIRISPSVLQYTKMARLRFAFLPHVNTFDVR